MLPNKKFVVSAFTVALLLVSCCKFSGGPIINKKNPWFIRTFCKKLLGCYFSIQITFRVCRAHSRTANESTLRGEDRLVRVLGRLDVQAHVLRGRNDRRPLLQEAAACQPRFGCYKRLRMLLHETMPR